MTETLRVLYAEDDPDIRAITEIALEDEGFDLIPCDSGEMLLSLAPSENPDLVLLDVMMPGMDGPNTLIQLRKIPHYIELPAIFMTAKIRTDEVEEYKAKGAIGVIAKPFDPMTLAEQIRHLLELNNG